MKKDETYGYAAVEEALSNVFGFEHAGKRGLLRARIQHLRRLGFLPASGRGNAINYGLDDAARIMVAIELEAFGCDPREVVSFIRDNWDGLLSGLVSRADSDDRDLFLIVHLNFLGQTNKIQIGHGNLSGLIALGGYVSQDDQAIRVGVFNLSSRMRALKTELLRLK